MKAIGCGKCLRFKSVSKYETCVTVEEAKVVFTFATVSRKEKRTVTVVKILTNKMLLLSGTEWHVFHETFVFALK